MADGPLLREIDDAVAEVQKRLKGDANRVVLVGPPASGKSSALARISKVSGRKRIVRVSGGLRDMDAAAVALTGLATGFEANAEHLVAGLRKPGTWDHKVGMVMDVVRRCANETVVLFDELHVGADSGPAPLPFRARVEDLAQELFTVAGLKTVVTANDWPLKLDVVRLVGRSEPRNILAPEHWGELGPAATKLEKEGGDGLALLSPLHLRLRVALVDAGVGVSEALRPLSIPAAIKALFESLGAGGLQLRSVIARMSVVRLPFLKADLARFGVGELDKRARAILERALLFGDAEGLRLHEAIAAEAQSWLREGERRQAHEEAANLHRARWKSVAEKKDIQSSVREELETLHHRTEAGDAGLLLDDSLWFSDQYVALGRALSLAKHRGDAVKAYERAVAHDGTNAYAHHYLAWNLDFQGTDAKQVEQHYGEAVARFPQHAWYQGRFINFLITRGRAKEVRAAWDRALGALLEVYSRQDERLYFELHRHVAGLLLHRGQLDFARDVLDDLPEDVRQNHAWARSEARLLRTLLEARDQVLVFPPRLPDSARWKPHLFPPTEVPVTAKWMAGNVVEHHEGTLHIRVAWKGAEEPTLAWLHIPDAELPQMIEPPRSIPAAGTFVEIVEYADGHRILRRYPGEPFEDDALPHPMPAPDRYLVPRGSSAN